MDGVEYDGSTIRVALSGCLSEPAPELNTCGTADVTVTFGPDGIGGHGVAQPID